MARLLQLFKRAKATELMAEWEEARQFYHQAKSLNPDHEEVKQRLAHLEHLEAIDAKIQRVMAEGDAQMQAGEYREAARTYALAIEHAGDAGILKYHAELEEKRNRAREFVSLWDRILKVKKSFELNYTQPQTEAIPTIRGFTNTISRYISRLYSSPTCGRGILGGLAKVFIISI
jgi:tetratricopeptide (TPR) repeat protein